MRFRVVDYFLMKKISRKITSTILLLPFFSIITFCCCLERDADTSVENGSIEHHQKLEKSDHHSEHQHQHSDDQDECSCPKHFSFLSQQPFEISQDLSSFQPLTKNFVGVPQFEVVLLSSSLLRSQGPPGLDHRDYVTTPIFLKNSNLRI